MNNTKIAELIERKNRRLEDQAVQTAEQHIESILQLTSAIEEAKKEILERQAALKSLEIQTVSVSSILGE